MAAEAGQLELNAFEPVIFYTLFESIETLGHSAQTLTDNCILGITANEKHCKDLVNASAGIATALCPSIGYAASAALAKESLKTNVAVRTLAVTKGYVTEAEADKLLDPYTMTGKRLEKSSCYNYLPNRCRYRKLCTYFSGCCTLIDHHKMFPAEIINKSCRGIHNQRRASYD